MSRATMFSSSTMRIFSPAIQSPYPMRAQSTGIPQGSILKDHNLAALVCIFVCYQRNHHFDFAFFTVSGSEQCRAKISGGEKFFVVPGKPWVCAAVDEPHIKHRPHASAARF